MLVAAAICSFIFFGAKRGTNVAMTPSGGFGVNGEYPTVDSSSLKSVRYGSWSGSDAKVGTLSSASFRAGFGIALAISGYPSHKDEVVFIERDDGKSQKITISPDPGERWSRLIVPFPLSWFAHRVRLIATDDSTAFQGWIGISELRRASLFEILARDVRVRLLLLTLLTGSLVFPVICGGLLLCRRAGLPNIFIFGATLLIAGIAAECQFFLTMMNTLAATTLVIAATVICLCLSAIALRSIRVQRTLRDSDTWMPFAVTFSCAVLYLIVITLTVPADASPFSLQPLKLPADNTLPHLLAIHIAFHFPAKPFAGDWLSSDRPPLQAGFDLITSALFPFIVDADLRYQTVSQLLQATIFGSIFTLARLCNAGTLRSLGVVALSVFSGFFFVNTVYVWPKLIAASYLAIALAIGIQRGRTSRRCSVGIGIATALALLSHGGIAFTTPALLVALIIKERARSVGILAVAGICAIVLLAPWSWYQHMYDPPGDRLLKWHLAGQIPPSEQKLTKLLIDAYTNVPLFRIVMNKESNFHALMGDPLTSSADRQFYFVRYALGGVALPFLIALFAFPLRRFRKQSYIAWIAATSIVVWCLVMYLPASTVVHQGSYLTIALMFVAGGLIATEWFPLFIVLLGLGLYDFTETWLAPFVSRDVLTIGGIVSFLGSTLTLALIGYMAYATTAGRIPRFPSQRQSKVDVW